MLQFRENVENGVPQGKMIKYEERHMLIISIVDY